MKKNYFNRALVLFNAFKSRKITTADFDKAAEKSQYLDTKVSDFNVLLNMGKDVYAGKYKMSKWNMSVIVATIVYVVSPLDAIPDVIPVLGWLDDVTIVGYAFSKLADEIAKYKTFKDQQVVTTTT